MFKQPKGLAVCELQAASPLACLLYTSLPERRGRYEVYRVCVYDQRRHYPTGLKLAAVLPAGTGTAPVSYTHLDVYKRQVLQAGDEIIAVCEERAQKALIRLMNSTHADEK